MTIECGFCAQPASTGAPCPNCRHDPTLPYTQRGTEPVVIPHAEPGRPKADAAAIRRRLRDAEQQLGGTATAERLAELLGVSPRTVRRWQQMAG